MTKAVRAWCLVDVGNSAFATTVMAAVLPVYFSSVAAVGLDPDPERARVLATARWGYANTIGMVIVALLAPMLGALADAAGLRRNLLAAFAFTGCILTAGLFFVGQGDWLLCLVLYGAAFVAFSGSFVLSDGLLPHVVEKASDLDRVSAQAYAWGYLGGGLLLAVQLAAILFPSRFGLADEAAASRWAFVSVAVWWAAFTIPLLRHVREPKPDRVHGGWQAARDSFARLRRTFHELREHREALKFLAAFWLYNDGIGTIVKMATIFGAEVGIGRSTLIGALLMVQLLGFPFALLFGRFARRIGAKRAIHLGLLGYLILCVLGYFLRTGLHFWLLAAGVSIVQGGTQALSRSLFAGMIPSTDRSGEFFGFYNVSSKFAGILGPLLFASVGAALGSSRYGVLALVVFFAIGAAVLTQVRPERSHGPLGLQKS